MVQKEVFYSDCIFMDIERAGSRPGKAEFVLFVYTCVRSGLEYRGKFVKCCSFFK